MGTAAQIAEVEVCHDAMSSPVCPHKFIFSCSQLKKYFSGLGLSVSPAADRQTHRQTYRQSGIALHSAGNQSGKSDWSSGIFAQSPPTSSSPEVPSGELPSGEEHLLILILILLLILLLLLFLLIQILLLNLLLILLLLLIQIFLLVILLLILPLILFMILPLILTLILILLLLLLLLLLQLLILMFFGPDSAPAPDFTSDSTPACNSALASWFPDDSEKEQIVLESDNRQQRRSV